MEEVRRLAFNISLSLAAAVVAVQAVAAVAVARVVIEQRQDLR